MADAANAKDLSTVTWQIRRETDEGLAAEASGIGMSKVALARLLLDFGIAQLRKGHVRIVSRSGIPASEDVPEDSEKEVLIEGSPPLGGRGVSTGAGEQDDAMELVHRRTERATVA